MVYRLLRYNTVDLYYKNGLYFEVDLDQRAIALARIIRENEDAEAHFCYKHGV
jgi:hypothetical protein